MDVAWSSSDCWAGEEGVFSEWVSLETGRGLRRLLSGAIKAKGKRGVRSVLATICAENRTFATLSLSVASGEVGRRSSSRVRSRRERERDRARPLACRGGRSLITGRACRPSPPSPSLYSSVPLPFSWLFSFPLPMGVANWVCRFGLGLDTFLIVGSNTPKSRPASVRPVRTAGDFK